MWVLELNPGPLKEQLVLLTSEPSFQPQVQILNCKLNMCKPASLDLKWDVSVLFY